MTTAKHTSRTVTEHRFILPCEEPHGGDYSDFTVALAWARQKASDLGINTSFDNWITFHCEDDQLVLVLVETSKEVEV